MPAPCCKDRWERLLQETPDMPVFTLLGKDMLAIETVEFWLARAKEVGVNPEKIAKVEDHLKWLVEFKRDHPEQMQIPD